MENIRGQFFRFENIYRRFDTEDKYLEESGQAEPGEILAVTGPSGSGKSTLLKILARLLKPESGEVFWHDRNWKSYDPLEWRQGIQFVTQKPVLFPGLIKENFALPFSLRLYRGKPESYMEKAVYYMGKMGLSSQILTQEARTLSGGEIARIALIRALIIEPEILLLDEPTAFLDQKARIQMIDMINAWTRESERATILVSHQDDDIKLLDCTTILHCPLRKAE